MVDFIYENYLLYFRSQVRVEKVEKAERQSALKIKRVLKANRQEPAYKYLSLF